MTADQFRQRYYEQPFRPFVLQTSDGERFEVRHPENMALSPNGRTVFVATGAESFKIIEMLCVTAMDLPNGRPAPEPPR